MHGSRTVAHSAPNASQGGGGGGGRQTLFWQVRPPTHALVPHCRSPPQPSEAGPHSTPADSHVTGTHGPHWLVTASHSSPLPQPPQSRVPPQPSGRLPQRPAQTAGWQDPHWPPTQTSPTGQLPQSTGLPHASASNPHSYPAVAHAPVRGAQVFVLGWQTLPLAHVPQERTPPQPS